MKLWNNGKYRDFRQSLIKNGQFAGCRGCCDLVPKPNAQVVRSNIDLVETGSEYAVIPEP